MFWTNTKRILRAGFVNFWRNGFVSLASVLVMTVTLLVIGGLLFGGALLKNALQGIESQVDISVYFVPTAGQSDITNIQTQVEALPQVASVVSVSPDTTLADFQTRNADDQTTLQALNEVNGNPFGGSLEIKAKDPSQYETIANFLQSLSSTSADGTSVIDRINYYQNATAIHTLTNMINGGIKLGIALIVILGLISIIIAFNTIRLAIYIARDEIAVMRLVGASNRYVRGPFVVSGIMYGIVAAFITLILFYPITYWVSSIMLTFFSGINLFSYYLSHFGIVFLLIIGLGIFLGAVSSYLAVRKYLRE